MPTTHPHTNDLLITEYKNGGVITNEDGLEDLHVYLPPAYMGRRYDLMQLSQHRIYLHTNHPETSFLRQGNPKTLIVESPQLEDTYGRGLLIEAYPTNFWRLLTTTFTETQLIFEVD